MNTKLYAGQVRNVTIFEKNISVLVEVYGIYDADNPKYYKKLKGGSKLVRFSMGLDNPKRADMHKGFRLALPAVGIAAEAADHIPDRRTGTKSPIFNLVGLSISDIQVVNRVELAQDELETEARESTVMAGADPELLATLRALGKGIARKVRSLVKS